LIAATNVVKTVLKKIIQDDVAKNKQGNQTKKPKRQNETFYKLSLCIFIPVSVVLEKS